MKIHWANVVGGVALLAMGVPVLAHTDSVEFSATHSTMIGGYKLAPGVYEFKADDSKNQVTVEAEDSGVVTKIPCKWIQLPAKANNTEVLSDDSGVTELTFAGKTEAASFGQ